jgi:hypothetical protein
MNPLCCGSLELFESVDMFAKRKKRQNTFTDSEQMFKLSNLHKYDAFPKMEKNIQHATKTGGFLTLLVGS